MKLAWVAGIAVNSLNLRELVDTLGRIAHPAGLGGAVGSSANHEALRGMKKVGSPPALILRQNTAEATKAGSRPPSLG